MNIILSRDIDSAVSLTFREALSGILGSISLTCWIWLLLPQLVESYRRGNADGISLAFLLVWLLGDLSNLIGSIWAQLVPLVITIAVYFCIADVVLICQCLHYHIRNARVESRCRRASISSPTPNTPLLGRRISDDLSQPKHWRRSSSSSKDHRPRHSSRAEDSLVRVIEEKELGLSAWVNNFTKILAVCGIGLAGWLIAWLTATWTPTPDRYEGPVSIALGAQVLGYFSAICYLSARLPQIYKNYAEKSCEGDINAHQCYVDHGLNINYPLGLSLLFFILSLMANLTYGSGILFHSTKRDYIVANFPWLIGSLGTMFEDIIIFVQFHLYAANGNIGSTV